MTAVTRIAELLARMDPTSLDAFCLARVQAMGKRVVDGDGALPTPEVGSTWVPTRSGAVSRWVRGVNEAGVYFRSGAVHRYCTLASWHRWRRRARAERQG